MCGITGQLKCFGKVEVIFANISEDAVEVLLYQGTHGRNPKGSECWLA